MLVIPPPTLDAREVKHAADFLAIASHYTRLRRAGRQLVGLCPFHQERHPSFYVEPERKIFYCFGCGAGGDVFDFVMRAEGCDFPQAVAILSELPVVERSGPGGCRRAAAPEVSGPATEASLSGVARESELRSSSRVRAGVGASPAPRSGAPRIARKPEPSRQFNALRSAEPELPGGCEAERVAAVRQVQCSRIGWVRVCKHYHLWHRIFRCGLRFCPLSMSSVYESLFHEAVERLEHVASRLVPEWPVCGHRPSRVIAKIDFTIRNTGEMPSAEKVRWFNKAIRRFFVRLARRNHWRKGEWGAAWCAEFGPGNTNLHAHAVFCGPWVEQKGRQASALWSEVVGEFAILSVKVARDFRHALRHAIKYPAASWKYFSASPERLAALEKAFYTVKRFHSVGAIYNPPADVKVPPTILASYDKCPTCGSRLEELDDPRWFSVDELMRMGSHDYGEWQRKRRLLGRGTEDEGAGPP